MSVAIIDYGSGNLRSAAKALERVAEGKREVRVIHRACALNDASHIVLPGVGAYADCMRGLRAVPGMLDALREAVFTRKAWFLGICVGMQMLLEKGFEHGERAGLGWMEGQVVPLRPADMHLKIPHMGWNELRLSAPSHPLLHGIPSGAHAYFVHSYHAKCKRRADILATTDYGGEVVAVIGRENIMGTQFHPEKSQETGLALLKNFIRL